MKNYTITVNGNVYDVTVEENIDDSMPMAYVPPKPMMPMPPMKAAPAPAAPSGAEGNIQVKAPLAGKILDIKVAVGASVKRGDPILSMEAMKMENEVVAPEDGTVATINVSVGNSIEAGDVLATLN